jgi:hypothetical protein
VKSSRFQVCVCVCSEFWWWWGGSQYVMCVTDLTGVWQSGVCDEWGGARAHAHTHTHIQTYKHTHTHLCTRCFPLYVSSTTHAHLPWTSCPSSACMARTYGVHYWGGGGGLGVGGGGEARVNVGKGVWWCWVGFSIGLLGVCVFFCVPPNSKLIHPPPAHTSHRCMHVHCFNIPELC